MSRLRTDDLTYGAEYWDTLDNGQGYQDSTMWEDLAHAVKEVFLIHDGRDAAGDSPVLDAGCGFGFFVRHLRRRGAETFGVDVSKYAIDHAPDDVAGAVKVANLTTPGLLMGFTAEFFGLIACFETMEHIEESKVYDALINFYQVLKPGGFALFTVCTEDQPGWDTDPTHITIKSHEWWQDRFRTATPGLSPRHDLEEALKRFWLFSAHHGVFVFQKV